MKALEYVSGSLLFAIAAANASAQTTFRADLDGSKTIPPAPTTATGTCEGTLNAAETEFTFSCTHNLVNATKGHIHRGRVTDPPSSETVVFTFAEADCCPESSTWALTPADVEDLLAGQLYVNIHSVDFTSEAIRGALAKDVAADDGPNGDNVVTPRVTGVCGALGAAALLMTFCGMVGLRAGRRFKQVR